MVCVAEAGVSVLLRSAAENSVTFGAVNAVALMLTNDESWFSYRKASLVVLRIQSDQFRLDVSVALVLYERSASDWWNRPPLLALPEEFVYPTGV